MGATGSLQSVVADIVKKGGPAALYTGIGAATVRVLPMAVSSFGTYELVRMMLSDPNNPLSKLFREIRQEKQCPPRLTIRPIDD